MLLICSAAEKTEEHTVEELSLPTWLQRAESGMGTLTVQDLEAPRPLASVPFASPALYYNKDHNFILGICKYTFKIFDKNSFTSI